MKTERILINENKSAKLELDRMAEGVCSAANDLVTIYHTFQKWERITSKEQFESYCQDPKKAMDQTLIKHSGVNLEATGGVLPEPRFVANMLGVEYDSYILVLQGKRVDENACKPCGKVARITKAGSAVLSFDTYQKFSDVLLFRSGHFVIDEKAIEERKKSFDHYIDSPEQVRVWNYWHNLEETINEASRLGYWGDLSPVQELTKGRLMFVPHLNRLALDEQALIHEIERIKTN